MCAGWAKVTSFGFFVALTVTVLAGTSTAATPNVASTDRQSREDAIRAIPFDQLNNETRAKLQRVVSSPSIYRRMPVEMVDCDPDLYLFLVRYPEIVVNIWRLMDITNVSVQRTGPFSMKTFDGSGTYGHIELVYGTRDTHIIYAEGYYEGPMFKRKITGSCVMVLKSGYAKDDDGRTKISNRMDMFIQIDNVGAEIIAKTLHPLVGRTADLNFAESTGFVGRLSAAAETNAEAVQRLSDRLREVDPTIREQFSRLAELVSSRNEPAEVRGQSPSEPDALRVTRQAETQP
ncbi:MAG: hypothetical protein RIC55_28055 [Pirellulaceae bacterium]